MPRHTPVSLQEFINKLLEDTSVRTTPTFPVDVTDTGDCITVSASLPGADKDSIDVQYHKDVLLIRATLKTPALPQHGQSLRRERYQGELRRSLSLPVPVAIDKALIQYRDGVLTLTLPKAAASRPPRIHLN